ncbi:MAG: CxxC-x17-CxxC domain-containing protein [archaeon]|jgi:CxxC-x17-CxxC domain-containing protein
MDNNRRFGNSRPSFGGPREMHKATCSDCGTETEVPFKPIEGRPVYCRDCYQKHKTDRPTRGGFRNDRSNDSEGSEE